MAAATTAAALLFPYPRLALAAPVPEPDITAKAAVLIDGDTGQVLFGKDAGRRSEPASTTKILTALVALRQGNLQDLVTVSKTAWGLEGSSAYLEPGEQQSLQNLLYALMLPSGNDAAEAIAEHIAGSAEGFAALMNETAAELGATHSHFANPHGLHDNDHYTTPRDLALIARAALANPEFARIVATKSFVLPGGHRSGLFYNHNKLLWRYDGATGVKTGYTSEAGSTLVASATRGDRRLIAVLMDDRPETIWSDAANLLDHGFALPAPRTVVQKGQVIAQLPVKGGKPKQVQVVAAGDLRLYLGGIGDPGLERRLELPPVLTPPLQAGQPVGHLQILREGEPLATVALLAAGSAAVAPAWPLSRAAAVLARAARLTARVFLWLAAAVASLLLLVLLVLVLQRGRRRRRRGPRFGESSDYVPLYRVIERNLGD